MERLAKYWIIFWFGAFGYGLVEMVWRGYTHWTMMLAGGICFSLLYAINLMNEALWRKWVMGAVTITTVEFVVGCVVNLVLGWRVWDYSDRAVHLMGQICPEFTFLWFGISIPAVFLAQRLRKALSEQMAQGESEKKGPQAVPGNGKIDLAG